MSVSREAVRAVLSEAAPLLRPRLLVGVLLLLGVGVLAPLAITAVADHVAAHRDEVVTTPYTGQLVIAPGLRHHASATTPRALNYDSVDGRFIPPPDGLSPTVPSSPEDRPAPSLTADQRGDLLAVTAVLGAVALVLGAGSVNVGAVTPRARAAWNAAAAARVVVALPLGFLAYAGAGRAIAGPDVPAWRAVGLDLRGALVIAVACLLGWASTLVTGRVRRTVGAVVGISLAGALLLVLPLDRALYDPTLNAAAWLFGADYDVVDPSCTEAFRAVCDTTVHLTSLQGGAWVAGLLVVVLGLAAAWVDRHPGPWAPRPTST